MTGIETGHTGIVHGNATTGDPKAPPVDPQVAAKNFLDRYAKDALAGDPAVFREMFPRGNPGFSLENLMAKLQEKMAGQTLVNCDWSDPALIRETVRQTAQENWENLVKGWANGEFDTLNLPGGYTREQFLAEVKNRYDARTQEICSSSGWLGVRVGLLRARINNPDLPITGLKPDALAQLVGDEISGLKSTLGQDGEYADFLEHKARLMKIFADKPELVLEQALLKFMAENPEQDVAQLKPGEYVAYVAKVFATQTDAAKLSKVKSKWDGALKDDRLDPCELADIMETFSKDGPAPTDREFLLMLWQMLQSQLEEALAQENQVTGKIAKEAQQEEFGKLVKEKIEQLEKSRESSFWGKFKKWAGVVGACVGAAVAWAVAGALIATGVGAGAGAALIVAAVALTMIAANMITAAATEEAGGKIDCFEQVGKGLAKAINGVFGEGTVNEDEVAMWTGFAINMALAIVATACTMGAASGTSAGAAANVAKAGQTAAKAGQAASKAQQASDAAKLGGTAAKAADAGAKGSNMSGRVVGAANMVEGACTVTNGVITGIAAKKEYDLEMLRAAILEIEALLEQIAEARQMQMDLAAEILQRIFGAMRGNLADAMDTHIQSIESIAAMHLNRA